MAVNLCALVQSVLCFSVTQTLRSLTLYPFFKVIWKTSKLEMKAANLARLCLPLPPTPTSSAFPRGDSSIRFIRQLGVEVQTYSWRRGGIIGGIKKRTRETESKAFCHLSDLLYCLAFRCRSKHVYQTLAHTKSTESVQYFSI